jgi:hypothetical protein
MVQLFPDGPLAVAIAGGLLAKNGPVAANTVRVLRRR